MEISYLIVAGVGPQRWSLSVLPSTLVKSLLGDVWNCWWWMFFQFASAEGLHKVQMMSRSSTLMTTEQAKSLKHMKGCFYTFLTIYKNDLPEPEASLASVCAAWHQHYTRDFLDDGLSPTRSIGPLLSNGVLATGLMSSVNVNCNIIPWNGGLRGLRLCWIAPISLSISYWLAIRVLMIVATKMLSWY